MRSEIKGFFFLIILHFNPQSWTHFKEHFDLLIYFLDQYVIDLKELTELKLHSTCPNIYTKNILQSSFVIVYQYKAHGWHNYSHCHQSLCTMILLIKHAYHERISSCECECEQKVKENVHEKEIYFKLRLVM